MIIAFQLYKYEGPVTAMEGNGIWRVISIEYLRFFRLRQNRTKWILSHGKEESYFYSAPSPLTFVTALEKLLGYKLALANNVFCSLVFQILLLQNVWMNVGQSSSSLLYAKCKNMVQVEARLKAPHLLFGNSQHFALRAKCSQTAFKNCMLLISILDFTGSHWSEAKIGEIWSLVLILIRTLAWADQLKAIQTHLVLPINSSSSSIIFFNISLFCCFDYWLWRCFLP